LASGSSSSGILFDILIRRIAAGFAAAVLLAQASCACAYTVTVEGLPSWQRGLAEKSLAAVAEKLPEDRDESEVARVVGIVSDKLFAGYRTSSVSVASGVITVFLTLNGERQRWRTELVFPPLQSPADGWFRQDAGKMEEEVRGLVEGVPLESLAWSDSALMDEILKLTDIALPGWKPSIVVVSGSGAVTLRVSFAPEMPLVLAISPRFVSNSLPMLLHGELKESLLARFAPFIGIPVEWADRHSGDIVKWAEDFLLERNIVAKTSSVPEASFSAAQISRMDVSVESRHYTLSAWAAVYAGTQDRSGELGLHIGRKAQIFPKWDMELYGEAIVELQDWDTEGRFGLRWAPWRGVWLGAEWSTLDDEVWTKVAIDPRLHKPYAWLRAIGDETNFAIGWKATEYISFEAHYDSRDSDSWSLRMIGNL
jgi:hypothetical protein